MQIKQICENFRDQYVTLNGVKLGLDDLSAGVLITGAIGSGKTTSWGNRLAKEIASIHLDQPDQKAAVIYFNTKGSGASQFLETLPKERLNDVIHLTSDKNCPHSIALFEVRHWRSLNECRTALLNWIEEVMTQITDSADSVDHDRQFWTSQRVHILNTLIFLNVAFSSNDQNFFNALEALLRRLSTFLDFVNQMRLSKNHNKELTEKFKNEGFTQFDFIQLKSWITQHQASKKRLSALFEKFMQWSKVLLNELDPILQPTQPLHPFDAFWKTLDQESQEKAEKLFFQFRHLADNTWSCVAADLQGIVSFFHSEPIATLLSASKKRVSFEDIVNQGKILIIDVPPADSGGGSRNALIALKTALMNRLLGRYQFSNQVRPVVLVIDEFHTITSVGRGSNGGDDMFLSRSREFGIIPIFAIQNLSLLQGVLRNDAKVFGLVSNLKTKIFGANHDLASNKFSSLCLGLKGMSTFAGMPWQRSHQTLRLLENKNGDATPLVTPIDFVNLQVGQAYVSTPSAVFFVDSHSSHSAPIVEVLKKAKS